MCALKPKKTPPPQGKTAQMTRCAIWCAANRTHPKPRKAKGSQGAGQGWACTAHRHRPAARRSGHRASDGGSSCRTHTAHRRTCQRHRPRNSGNGTREKTPYQGATPGASGTPGTREAQAANLRRFARQFVARQAYPARLRARARARDPWGKTHSHHPHRSHPLNNPRPTFQIF